MFFIILYYKSNRKLSNKIHISYFWKFISEDTPYKSLKKETNIEKVKNFETEEVLLCGVVIYFFLPNFTLLSMFQFLFLFLSALCFNYSIIVVSSARNRHCQLTLIFRFFFTLVQPPSSTLAQFLVFTGILKIHNDNRNRSYFKSIPKKIWLCKKISFTDA